MKDNHKWTFDLVNKNVSCCCGSWINITVVGTGWEGYATNCFGNDCQEAYFETLKQYNSIIKSTAEGRES